MKMRYTDHLGLFPTIFVSEKKHDKTTILSKLLAVTTHLTRHTFIIKLI